MKSIIIYASYHHGNTKKVVDTIAKECEVELFDVGSVREKDLSDYDFIGFASGIFYLKFAEDILDFARDNLPMNKDVFLIATAGNPRDGNFNSIAKIISEKKLGASSAGALTHSDRLRLWAGFKRGIPTRKNCKRRYHFIKIL